MTTPAVHSLEAESSVLGALLLDPRRALGPVRELLRPADFFDPRHAEVYTAALELEASGSPIDVVPLADLLGRKGKLARVGLEYLGELAGKVPTVENVGHYARIVRTKALTREIQQVVSEAKASGLEGEELLAEFYRSLGGIEVPRRRKGQTLRDALIPTLNKVETLGGKFLGLPTGLADLDRVLRGLRFGVETIIAARPQMGKSSLSAWIAQYTAETGGSVDYFSFEDSKEATVLRMIAQRAQVDNERLQSGDLTAVEWHDVHQASGVLHSFGDRLEIFDDVPDDAEEFCLWAKQHILHKRAGTGSAQEWKHLVVVDYVQKMGMREFKGKGDNRNAELTKVNRLLTKLPKECACSLIVVSQLKRNEGAPQLTDLRECGALEQDAEQVIMLDRPDWLRDADGHKIPACWAFVRKNKNGKAPDYPIALGWRGEYVRFYDCDEETRKMAREASKSQRKGKR